MFPVHGGYLRGQFNPVQAIIGAYSTKDSGESEAGGRIVVYTDSHLIDMQHISYQNRESEVFLVESLIKYLSIGDIPLFLTRLGHSSYEDPNLMTSISSKQTFEENTLKKENKLRYQDFLRSDSWHPLPF